MSMVPLNLGAAAPFKLKLHFEQVGAASGFWVPQFGQNTPHLAGTEHSGQESSQSTELSWRSRPCFSVPPAGCRAPNEGNHGLTPVHARH